MKIATWDSGLTFDNPNLRWGNPSYLLEAGDPGYVNMGPPAGYDAIFASKNHKTTKAMNETPQNPKVLRALAHDIADGLHTLQDVIHMKQNREADVRASLAKLDGDPSAPLGSAARKGSEAIYAECKAATVAAFGEAASLREGPVKKYLVAYRTMLVDVLGAKWSAAWIPAGFNGPSTAQPRSEAAQMALLTKAVTFLEAHPGNERPAVAPHTPVTAAQAQSLHDQMSEAREDTNAKEGDQESCKQARDADLKALAKRVSGTIAELDQVLGVADGRWETFGLNIPAHPTTPEAVTAVTLSPAGPGGLLAGWPHARRATRYLAWIQIAGTDPAPRLAGDTRELEFLFRSLPTGATVNVQIASSNPAGEAALSPVVTAVVG